MAKLPDEVEKELNDYMKEHNISDLFNHIAEALLLAKPEQPVRFILNYLIKEYPDQSLGATMCMILLYYFNSTSFSFRDRKKSKRSRIQK